MIKDRDEGVVKPYWGDLCNNGMVISTKSGEDFHL